MDLPLPIEEEVWGEIIYMEQYTPQIWFMEAKGDPERSCRGADGFFVVVKNNTSGLLSQEALSYGKEMDGLLYFDYDHGKLMIEYELLRNGIKLRSLRHDQVDHDLTQTLRDIAAIASEEYPEYFGPLAIPQNTPFGPVTRCKPIQNGVYLVEAGVCWALAISYPEKSNCYSNMYGYLCGQRRGPGIACPYL